jgi:hypothetical protein
MTYDPKRSRPSVSFDPTAPASVEDLVELPPDRPTAGSGTDPAAEVLPVDLPTEVSPFEPAGPPDQRLVKAIAVGVAAAGAMALMVAWRRRRS